MSSYWKDTETAFIAQAQDAALGPRKRKKNLPKGAASDSDQDQLKATAPMPKKSKPKKPKSKSAVMASKLFTGSPKKPSNSQTEIAPLPNHAENIEKATVPSDCENNATDTQQSDIDGENVLGLFGPDVKFDSTASSGLFDEDDNSGGRKATQSHVQIQLLPQQQPCHVKISTQLPQYLPWSMSQLLNPSRKHQPCQNQRSVQLQNGPPKL